jgi:hypothetical protein
MPTPRKPHPRTHAPLRHRPADEPPEPDVDVGDDPLARIVERPDGFHWIDVGGRQEFGPFPTVQAALADMQGPGDTDLAADEVIDAAEQGQEAPFDIEAPGEGGPEAERE